MPIAAIPTGWVPTASSRRVTGTATARAMTQLSTAIAAGGGEGMATVTATMATTIAAATVGPMIVVARATTEVTRTVWARPGETFPKANPSTPILAAGKNAAPGY